MKEWAKEEGEKNKCMGALGEQTEKYYRVKEVATYPVILNDIRNIQHN